MNGKNDSITELKKDLRSRLMKARNLITEVQRNEWSNSAILHMTQQLESMQISNMLVFISFRSELNTEPLIEWGWKNGIEVLAPRCDPGEYSMDIYPIRDWNELTVGAYGIKEPDPDRTTALGHYDVPEVIIMPGLAFDKSGGRLGYGGGYYDRLIERLQPYIDPLTPPILIGLGYEMQVLSKLPKESHDARMDWLVTENGIISCEKEAE